MVAKPLPRLKNFKLIPTSDGHFIFSWQITLSTIFESMGWRVFRVPETATILLGGGVSFSLLDDEQRLEFQVDFSVDLDSMICFL